MKLNNYIYMQYAHCIHACLHAGMHWHVKMVAWVVLYRIFLLRFETFALFLLFWSIPTLVLGRSRESRFHSCKAIQSFREENRPLLSPATQHNWRWRGFSLLSLGASLLYNYIHFIPIKTDHWRPPAPGTLSSVPRPPHSIDTQHRAVYTPHTVLPLMTEGQPCHRVANGNLPLSWEPEQCKISGGNNADWVSPLGSIRVMRFCTHRIQSPNFTLRVNHKSMYTHIEWQRVNCVAKVAIEVLWVKTFFSGFSPDWGAIGLQRIWPSIVYSLLIHRDL